MLLEGDHSRQWWKMWEQPEKYLGKTDMRLGVQQRLARQRQGQGMQGGVTGRGRSLNEGERRLGGVLRILAAL